MLDTLTEKLTNFRKKLYNLFPARRDSIMDLIDSIAGNVSLRSPAELSLSSLFPRTYNSVYDAIENVFKPSSPEKAQQERSQHQQRIMELVSETLPCPKQRKFRLFVTDQTPAPRPYSKTLKDRGYVYSPNPVPNKKPIDLGHSYSFLAALPEKMMGQTSTWVVPLNIQRVPTNKNGKEIALQQIEMLMNKKTMSFHAELCVQVVDSAYSVVNFLHPVMQYKNLVTIARLSGARVLFRQHILSDSQKKPGHPKWYGQRFDLLDTCTWGEPDEKICIIHKTRNGSEWFVRMSAWHNLLMTGKRNLKMHHHPFTLVRIVIQDRDGKQIYQKPMWLIVVGDRRSEISLTDVLDAYRQRFDIEHFFRFSKNRLLLISYQTPEVEHEENWWECVGIAYTQLWLCRDFTEIMPRPWERYNKQHKVIAQPDIDISTDVTVQTNIVLSSDMPFKTEVVAQSNVSLQTDDAPPINIAASVSPSEVQRDFERIIRQIGTPAKSPERRGNSPGRPLGWSPGRRERCPVIKKGGTTLPRGPP